MIGFIQGKIIDIDMTECVILTNWGVGYTIQINELIYARIALEENVEFHIYHHRTENSEALFGFIEKYDKTVFTELIKISWVGWKVAMLILTLWVEKLIWSVQMADNKTIEGIKGIWKKMAEKIILELRDKDFVVNANIVTSENKTDIIRLESHIAADIKNTLVNMWYQPSDVDMVLSRLPAEMEDIWTILPYCIRELS
jgi:Holliday junction DNA helicase RuvA subunit